MTKQYAEGFKEGQEAFQKKLTSVVKRMTLETLEAIEAKKADKAKVEEELRVLKMDLEDLKEGKIDRIKERQSKSPLANNVSVIDVDSFSISQPCPISQTITTSTFPNMTAGTYTLHSGTVFYL